MLEMMKGYLQLAAGLGEMSRRKAMDAARDLVEGTPVAGLRAGAGPEALAGQVAVVADELLTIGRQNRRLLAQLVRTETEAVLASLGVGPDRGSLPGAGDRLDDQLRALRDRVDDLERRLRERAGGSAGTVTSGTRTSSGPRTTTKATAKRAATTTSSSPRTATKATTKRAVQRTTKAATPAVTKRVTKTAAGRATKTTMKRAAPGTTSAAAGRGRPRGATS